MIIEKQNIPLLNLKGQGGKEGEFAKILLMRDGWVRRNHNLYDYENDRISTLLEIKKQQDVQWFDPSKYANLSDIERDITILFCLTDEGGRVEKLFTVITEDFINRVYTKEHLLDSFQYKLKYPKTQLKDSISIRKFFKNNIDIIDLIYTI